MTTHASRPRLRLLAAALASLALLGSAGALASTYQLNYKIPGLVKKAPVSEQAPAPEADTDFTSHTFTTCGQAGRFGPTLAQCQNAYTGAEILDPSYSFMVASGIQEWTVPVNGVYRITAYGAQGASDNNTPASGGLGAMMQGEFSLTAGSEIKILVGQRGSTSSSGPGADGYGGGGGGTFVATGQNAPLIVAAGGNGANMGYAGPDGSSEIGSGYGLTTGDVKGGCGGGFLTNGSCSRHGADGLGFIEGATGGHASSYNADGGFGGGSGTTWNGSGAGGGYQGGSGFDRPGGTSNGVPAQSFNSGTNQSNQDGANTGDGKVIIEKL